MHKPGTAITQADPLSHLSTHQVANADDNHDQVVLKPQHFTATVNASAKSSNLLEQDIRTAADRDQKVVLALRLLKEHGP